MTVLSTTTDTTALTTTLVAELAAPPSRVWQLWSDPRQVERWWGPPTWPATFAQHDFLVGGESRYVMTGPDGGQSGGWWRFLALDEPHGLVIENGFADAAGQPVPGAPAMTFRVAIVPEGAATRMTVTTQFASLADLQQVLGFGMLEGMAAAVGQIDALL